MLIIHRIVIALALLAWFCIVAFFALFLLGFVPGLHAPIHFRIPSLLLLWPISWIFEILTYGRSGYSSLMGFRCYGIETLAFTRIPTVLVEKFIRGESLFRQMLN